MTVVVSYLLVVYLTLPLLRLIKSYSLPVILVYIKLVKYALDSIIITVSIEYWLLVCVKGRDEKVISRGLSLDARL